MFTGGSQVLWYYRAIAAALRAAARERGTVAVVAELEVAVAEMERRYALLSDLAVRNIEGFSIGISETL